MNLWPLGSNYNLLFAIGDYFQCLRDEDCSQLMSEIMVTVSSLRTNIQLLLDQLDATEVKPETPLTLQDMYYNTINENASLSSSLYLSTSSTSTICASSCVSVSSNSRHIIAKLPLHARMPSLKNLTTSKLFLKQMKSSKVMLKATVKTEHKNISQDSNSNSSSFAMAANNFNRNLIQKNGTKTKDDEIAVNSNLETIELLSNSEKKCSRLSPKISKAIHFPVVSLQSRKEGYFNRLRPIPPPPPQRLKRRKRLKEGQIVVTVEERNWNITRSRSGNATKLQLLPMVVDNIFFVPSLPSKSVETVSEAVIKTSHKSCNRPLPPIPFINKHTE